MHLDAILTERDDPNGRLSRRRTLKLSVGVQAPTGDWTSVVIHNIGNGGLLLEANMVTLEIGDTISLELPEKGPVQAEVVWVNAPFFGCRISDSLSSAEIAAALLRSDPTDDARVDMTGENRQQISSNDGVIIGPGLNFTVAFGLSMMLWALIALVVYLVY